jgi:hypothetical protein
MTTMKPSDSAARIADAVRVALSRGVGEAEPRRIVLDFVPQFDAAPPEERATLVNEQPPSTGDPRYDALLGALVEHLCLRSGTPIPAWVEDPDRFIETWWFVSGLRRLHASALVQSPISFARRGVFICDGALTYA